MHLPSRRLSVYRRRKPYKPAYVLKISLHLLYINFRLRVYNNGGFLMQKMKNWGLGYGLGLMTGLGLVVD